MLFNIWIFEYLKTKWANVPKYASRNEDSTRGDFEKSENNDVNNSTEHRNLKFFQNFMKKA